MLTANRNANADQYQDTQRGGMDDAHPKDLPRGSSRGVLLPWRLSDPLERI